MPARLALFDLDDTLLDGDSDRAWGEFLVAEGLADPVRHREGNERFYRQYLDGELDVRAYVRFALGPVLGLPPRRQRALRDRFVRERARPMMLEAGAALVRRHREAGDRCVVITSTNAFVAGPVARAFGARTLLATGLETAAGRLTGEVDGTPCYRRGKVEKLARWLAGRRDGLRMADGVFYTDSVNDLPLLERVAEPVAVDPDRALAAAAAERGWPVISLRGRPGTGPAAG